MALKAFVTGAAGYLGKHLCKAMLAELWEVCALVRDRHREAWPEGVNASSLVFGDLCDAPLLARAISQYEPDVVIHLAAQTDVRIALAEPLSTWESNVRGTWNLMEACRTQKVNRVIVASTDKAYGWTPPPYKEADPVRASGCYETSKACADLIAQSYEKTYDISVSITRCGNFYGPGRYNWATLIPGTIKSVIEKKRPVLRTDGTFRRDFMYIDDGVSAYMALAKSDATGPFNFGTGEPLMVIDVVKKICEMMDWTDGIEIIPTAKGEIVDQYLDTTRARTELGWSPQVPFEEGLHRTIAWYRSFFNASHS